MSRPRESLRKQLRVIIFGTHTRAGRTFDILLIILILVSVALVFLESVKEVSLVYGPWLRTAEWTITILFSIEYITRLWISDNWRRYAFGSSACSFPDRKPLPWCVACGSCGSSGS